MLTHGLENEKTLPELGINRDGREQGVTNSLARGESRKAVWPAATCVCSRHKRTMPAFPKHTMHVFVQVAACNAECCSDTEC